MGSLSYQYRVDMGLVPTACTEMSLPTTILLQKAGLMVLAKAVNTRFTKTLKP